MTILWNPPPDAKHHYSCRAVNPTEGQLWECHQDCPSAKLELEKGKAK